MIAESVAFLVGAGQARSSSTPSTSSTASRRPRLRARVPAGGRPTPGRELDRLCDTNGAHAAAPDRRRRAHRGRRGATGRAARHPHPQRRRAARWPTRWPPWSRARAGAGHDQRLRRALRQRQPGLDHPRPAAEDGLRGSARRRLDRADRDRPLRRRDCQPARPTPGPPYVGRNAFAHKGGMHVAGVHADARTFEHIDPAVVGNERDVLVSELSGRGDDRRKGARDWGSTVEGDDAPRVIGAPQGARARGLPVRGGRRRRSSC